MDQAVAMSIDSVKYLELLFLSLFIGGENVGNMALNMVVDKQLPIGNQFKEKSTSETAVVVDGDMEGMKDLKMALLSMI